MVAMQEDDVTIYKNQTLAIESLLDHHPEFAIELDSSFTADEAQVFQRVFSPNWEEFEDDYRKAYAFFLGEGSDLLQPARAILKRWCVAHGVNPADLRL